eukprot:m.132101 g.132101  ORF g.132101 m.132101 type:complete len:253 (+) comp13085_c0_seq6:1315-2073(+)
MIDLLLDPEIRVWVVLPIVIITFCVGMCKTYIIDLIKTPPQIEKKSTSESQLLQRCARLRMNGKFIPRHSFEARRDYFVGEEGVLTRLKESNKEKTPNPMQAMQDPSMMTNMLKMQVVNYIPMVAVVGLINWAFAGFVIIKVPFPLTIAFKPMLQRGVELSSLSASWVSSMSFYVTCVVGLRGLNSMLLGSADALDPTAMMRQQQQAMSAQPKNIGQLANNESDNLTSASHDGVAEDEEEVWSDLMHVWASS